MNHNVGDLIIRIKNAYLAKRKEAIISYSKFSKEIMELLVQEGFLREVKEKTLDGKKVLVAVLRYERRIPIFTDTLIVSKPSLRIYATAKSLKGLQRRGLGIAVLSTNQGVMTEKEAKKKGIGGEVLFRIW